MNRSKYIALCASASLIAACGGSGGGSDTTAAAEAPAPSPTFEAAKFLPASKKTLIFVGQDIDANNNYTKNTGNTPAGVTMYTSLNLDSLYARNHGQPEGAQDWNSVKVGYKNSAVAVGLYMAGSLLDQYSAGSATLDANVDKLIDELQSFNRPVFLRIGYEADANFNNHDPDKYKAAWRKIVSRIRAKNATNIATVWQVLGICGTSATLNNRPTEDWYPGDDIVDWTGFSWFRGDPTCTVNQLKTNHPTKPIMIAEWAPSAYAIADGTYNPDQDNVGVLTPKTGAQIWNEKIKLDLNFIQANKDYIRAAAYINQDWKSYSTWQCKGAKTPAGITPCSPGIYWGDTRLEADPTIKQNWLNAILDPQYISSTSPALFNQLNQYQPSATNPALTKGAHRRGGAASPLPGIIEAESYDRGGEGVGYHELSVLNTGYQGLNNVLWRANEGVDILTFGPTGVTDGSEKFAVTNTEAGEWLDYSISAVSTGSYPLKIDVASAGAGGMFEVLVDGVAIGNPVMVPDTGGATQFRSITAGNINLTSLGAHTLRLKIISVGANGSAGNFDKISVAEPRGPYPFGSAAPTILASGSTIIRAENYDVGGEGIAYHDSDVGKNTAFVDLAARPADSVELVLNGADHSVGYTAVGEWLEYTVNVAQAGKYQVIFNVAPTPAGGGLLEVSQNGAVLGSANGPACPAGVSPACDYNNYRNTSPAIFNLAAGVQTLRVTFKTAAPGNVNTLTFSPSP
jgi:DUF5010 C-terminal domain/Carbohydrate binding module (family 6)